MSTIAGLSDGHTIASLGPEYHVKRKGARISLVPTEKRNATTRKRVGLHTLSEIFLPSGFPDKVTPDYIRYQIFDSLQAFSSSIAGLLSSRAVLEGFGVGDEKASSTNAVLLSVIQDATGRIATILFAWKYGPALAPEAKMYRLAADLFNDSAIVLDCLSPALPTQPRVAVLCFAGALRAVCGVCAGGAKAALSVHFAKAGNVGELNAKDASQETVIGLLGMLCGSFVMSHVTSRPATWTVLLLLLITHLVTNYFAVRAVTFTTLNRQRANIAYGLYSSQEGGGGIAVVPSPSEVARIERIFEVHGAVRDPVSREVLGTCRICSSAEEFLHRSGRETESSWRNAIEVFRDENYVLLGTAADGPLRLLACFKREASPEEILKAWINAYVVCRMLSKANPRRVEEASKAEGLNILKSSLERTNNVFPDFLEKAEKAGWNLVTDAICTGPVRTLDIQLDESEIKKTR